MNDQLNTYLYPVSLSLLFAVSCIVSFKRRNSNRIAGVFLALMYWSFFYSLLAGYLNNSGFIYLVPHLFRTSHAATLLFMPFSFMYISYSLNPRQWEWRNLLHFLPFCLYVVDYSAFFLQPAAQKMAIYEAVIGSRLLSDFNEGLFAPKGFHVWLRYVQMAVYWIAQLVLIWQSNIKYSTSLSKEDQSMFNWLKRLNLLELILIFPPLFNLILSIDQVRVINQFSGIVAALAFGFYLLLKPEILYGFNSSVYNEIKPVLAEAGKKHNGSPTASLLIMTDPKKTEWMQEMVSKLESHFCDNKPYMKRGYSLQDLAAELGYSTNQLSLVINHHYGMHFNSLINKHRIQLCLEKMAKEEFREKTLEAIAIESGFHSRGTFINAFKSHTGFTPSAYIRQMA